MTDRGPFYDQKATVARSKHRSYPGVYGYYTYPYPLSFPMDLNNWQLPLRLKVQDLMVNLSGFIAEIHKTHTAFIGAAKLIHKVYLAWKRKQLICRQRNGDIIFLSRRRPKWKCRKTRRILSLDDVSSSVLLTDFGIKPAVLDLLAALNAADDWAKRDPWIRVKITVKGEHPITGSTQAVFHKPAQVTDYVVVYVQPSFSFATSAGVDFGGPLEWAWELIPYSFVVDWMIGVGDWLTALSAFDHVAALHGAHTQRVKLNTPYDQIQSHRSNNVPDVPGQLTTKYWRREVLSGVGDVSLPDFPELDPTDSLSALRNAIALLHQVRSRR
jgi:hypothetical protein